MVEGLSAIFRDLYYDHFIDDDLVPGPLPKVTQLMRVRLEEKAGHLELAPSLLLCPGTGREHVCVSAPAWLLVFFSP